MQIRKRYSFFKAHPRHLSEIFLYLLEQDTIAICQICCNKFIKSNDVHNRMEAPLEEAPPYSAQPAQHRSQLTTEHGGSASRGQTGKSRMQNGTQHERMTPLKVLICLESACIGMSFTQRLFPTWHYAAGSLL